MTLAKPIAPPSSERRRRRRSKSAIRCAIDDESSGRSIVCMSLRSIFPLTLLLPITSPVSPATSRACTVWRLVLPWVHRVPQAIANEAETEHRQGDRQGRKEPEIPINAHVLRTVGDHFTQTRGWLVDADAEKAQT